jgi:hypothetical protein
VLADNKLALNAGWDLEMLCAPAREMAAEIKDRGRRTRSSGGQSIG